MAPLSPACPGSQLSMLLSPWLAPYFPKDGFILFPFGTSGLWDAVQLSSPSEWVCILMPIFPKGRLRSYEENYCLINKMLWCTGKVIFEHEINLQDSMKG